MKETVAFKLEPITSQNPQFEHSRPENSISTYRYRKENKQMNAIKLKG
jgi:hypothetical protein